MSSTVIIAYSGDTRFHPDLLEHYKGADILILNVPTVKDTDDNLNLGDAVKIIQHTEPALAILTHFNHKMIEADPIYLAREVQKQTGVQTITAKDGLIINPANYDAKSKQTMLKGYSSSL